MRAGARLLALQLLLLQCAPARGVSSLAALDARLAAAAFAWEPDGEAPAAAEHARAPPSDWGAGAAPVSGAAPALAPAAGGAAGGAGAWAAAQRAAAARRWSALRYDVGADPSWDALECVCSTLQRREAAAAG